MASEILGRSPCPECGFAHAHIKIKTDKDGANPYRHCPDCGAQYFTRSKAQAEQLREKIKTAQQQTAPEVVTLPVEKPEVPPKKMVFGVLV